MTVKERERQRTEALEKANRVRVSTAQLKREIASMSFRSGLRRCADIFEAESSLEDVRRITVRQLLLSVRRMGDSKMGRIVSCVDQRLSVDRRIGDLSPRQRERFVKELREAAARKVVMPDSSALTWMRPFPPVGVTPEEENAWNERVA